MRILHLSDVGLPDTRVERAALHALKKGWEVVFAGGRPAESQLLNVFKKIHYRHWRPVEKTGFPTTLRKLKQWLKRLIHEEKPDLIHAHDLFAGKLALEVGHPFVYDDHEIWASRISHQGSQAVKRDRTLIRRTGAWFALRTWRKWEPDIIQSTPVITVSEEIAKLYQRLQPQTFVIPNLPTSQEVAMIPPNQNIAGQFRIAMISRDNWPLQMRPDRGALQVWLDNRFGASLVFIGPIAIETEEVENHGYVSHEEMLRILSTCDAALLGQRWDLPLYSFQNRFPYFLHAGLKVIVPIEDVTQVNFSRQHDVGWSWNTPNDLKELIHRLAQEYHTDEKSWNLDKHRVRKVAKNHLLWGNYANQLEKAYDAALSN
jgi:glycosyltransferase involved in cell wall biosynthesis